MKELKVSSKVELRRVAFLLTFIGGMLEIYSYKLKDGIFATAITGNIVRMVYYLNRVSGDNIRNIIKYGLPILFFILGVSTTEILKINFKNFNIKIWREVILSTEIMAMIIIPFIPSDVFSVSLIAFVSGAQVQAFRKVYGKVYMSTMCTGNTRSLVEAVINKRRDEAKLYVTVILGFISGVLVGDYIIIYIDKYMTFICVILLILIINIIRKEE